MKHFNNFNLITEKYVNLFSEKDKLTYLDEIYSMLDNAYKSIGGMKINGISKKEDLLNIPFWKVVKKDKQILSVVLYKMKDKRKLVAFASNGTKEGKETLIKLFKDEMILQRGYSEISENVLNFLIKNLGEDFILKYIVPVDKVKEVLYDKEILPNTIPDNNKFKEYYYMRKLGDTYFNKIMIGIDYLNLNLNENVII